MAATTTLPAASVVTTLSNSQGASTSVQQPIVQVTATTGSTAITEMMGAPGPAGPIGAKGDTGATGPAAALSIGTVSTLAAGTPATASITGTAPNQVLNLGLPLPANQSAPSLYQRPYRPGAWYPVNIGSIGSGVAAGTDTLLWTPFLITQQVTVDSLLTRITTASSTGSIRIYLYAPGSNYWPYGAPLAATATLSAAISQIVQGDVAPVTLTPGLYWFAYHASDSAVSVANGSHLEAANIMGHDDPSRTFPANNQAPWGYRSNGFVFSNGPPTITIAPNYYSGSGVNRLPTGFFRVAA